MLTTDEIRSVPLFPKLAVPELELLFGELPVALNTPLFGSYRAAKPSRVMRIELPQYFAIAAASPQVAMRVAELARNQISFDWMTPDAREARRVRHDRDRGRAGLAAAVYGASEGLRTLVVEPGRPPCTSPVTRAPSRSWCGAMRSRRACRAT